ncbi:hypothetical protein [Streptomyces sp. NPDC001401]|uniref:hypothetical protein n=1 Tax=Streptomyces sp. NPDC001401 TaxID=3364570 RepID=UPI0036B9C48F
MGNARAGPERTLTVSYGTTAYGAAMTRAAPCSPAEDATAVPAVSGPSRASTPAPTSAALAKM